MAKNEKFLLLGVGNVAIALSQQVLHRGTITGTTRSPERTSILEELGIAPLYLGNSFNENDVKKLADAANILVSFPPDGKTDALLAPWTASAKSIVYLSSTGVYGDNHGCVNESTPVSNSTNAKIDLRLKAEKIWQAQGATILRCAAIYGPTFGLHKLLQKGQFVLPADASQIVSRIYVDDLAAIILAAFGANKNKTYVVADSFPTAQLQVVQWLCQEMKIPMPAQDVDASQKAHAGRSIDSSFVLKDLAVQLQYPSYKEGFRQCLSESAG